MCLDRLVGAVRIRLVVHRQDHAGRRLHEERGQRRRAERVVPPDVRRDLAEEEVLDAADEAGALLQPVDRVRRDLNQRPLLLLCRRRRHQLGRLPRIEQALDAVDVLARSGKRVARDLRGGAGSFDVRDAVRPEQHEIAVADLELVAVERAHGRAGGAVSLGVVLTAVAGAAEAGGLGRDDRDRRGVFRLDDLLLLVEHGPARLDGAAEVRAAVRDDREARHAVRDAVVADVRRPPRHLALLRVAQERRDHVLPFGEVVERAEVDAARVLVDERGRDHEPERRARRRGRRSPRRGRASCPRGTPSAEYRSDRPSTGTAARPRGSAATAACRAGRVSGSTSSARRVAARRVADPERRADDRDRRAGRGDVPAEDQARAASTPHRSQSRSARGSDPGDAVGRDSVPRSTAAPEEAPPNSD